MAQQESEIIVVEDGCVVEPGTSCAHGVSRVLTKEEFETELANHQYVFDTEEP